MLSGDIAIFFAVGYRMEMQMQLQPRRRRDTSPEGIQTAPQSLAPADRRGFACKPKAKRPFVHNLFIFSLAFVLTFEDRQCPGFLL